MLRDEMAWVMEVARQIAKEEITLAIAAIPKAKVAKPEINHEPAPEPVKAEAPVKKGK
jgi:hypothetical protein